MLNRVSVSVRAGAPVSVRAVAAEQHSFCLLWGRTDVIQQMMASNLHIIPSAICS